MANIGTPRSIPANPHISPNRNMEKSTHILEIPVVSPIILGPKILPSICCNIKSKITKKMHCMGLTISMRSADKNNPIYHPKNGITLKIPTITATSVSLIMTFPGLIHLKIIMPA